jgi:hypothetical protein
MAAANSKVTAISLLAVLLLGVAGPSVSWVRDLNNVRARYTQECTPNAGSGQATDDWSAAKGSMKEQSSLLLNWALAATGGVIAAVTTTTVHSFSGLRLLYLLFGPVLSLLTGSMWAALLFQRRVTFLELNSCAAGGTLNDLLLAQGRLLQYALLILGLFGVVCLGQIVTGHVNPKAERN